MNHGGQFFSIWNHHKYLSCFWFILIHMSWMYGKYKYAYSYSAGIDFSRHNLTSTDVTSKVDPRAVRVKRNWISTLLWKVSVDLKSKQIHPFDLHDTMGGRDTVESGYNQHFSWEPHLYKIRPADDQRSFAVQPLIYLLIQIVRPLGRTKKNIQNVERRLSNRDSHR